MSYVLFVTKSQRLKQDLTNIASLFLVVKSLGHNAIEQLPSPHQLGNEIVMFRLVEDIVELDDILMVQCAEDTDLISEREVVLASQFGFGDNFCGVESSISAFDLFDFRKGTFSEL